MFTPDPAVEAARAATRGSANRIDVLMDALEDEIARRGSKVPAALRSPVPMGCFEPIPVPLRLKLHDHCQRTGERPSDVVADALALHLDALEGECLCERPDGGG